MTFFRRENRGILTWGGMILITCLIGFWQERSRHTFGRYTDQEVLKRTAPIAAAIGLQKASLGAKKTG